MGRMARSWDLTKLSYRVLMQDKELLLLPAISGACILVVCGTFLGVLFALGGEPSDDGATAIALLPMYFVAYSIAFFFQAALIAGATERLSGGDPTLGSALGAASRRLPAILLWGLVAATVGVILRAIEERSGLVGKLVAMVAGIAWSLATYFMVPVLVLERESIGDSFRRSRRVFRETWGETVSGNFGVGLISFFTALLCIAAAFLLGAVAGPVVGIVFGVVAIALQSVFFSALHGVFVASLYRYATTGEVTSGYRRDLLADAFRRRR